MEVMHNDHAIEERNVITPADWVPGPQQGDWTYEAYAALTADGECYEIVQGVLVMPPSPEDIHQDATGEIFAYLREQIKLKGLVGYLSPRSMSCSRRKMFFSQTCWSC